MKLLLSAFLAFFLTESLLPVSAQESEPVSPSEMEKWLNGPNRRDMPWRVWVSQPMLTFQQRYLVVVGGSIDISAFRKEAVRDVTVQIKVADSKGTWLPGEDSTAYQVPVTIPESIIAIRFSSAVYALPGNYRVAVVLFDKARKVVNVSHNKLHVPTTNGNALSDLVRDLPVIEFPMRLPGMNKDGPPMKDRGFSLAQGVEHLPIPDTRPLLVDILLDFSEPDAIDLPYYMSPIDKGRISQSAYYRNLKLMLQMGSVLSHLQPANGCVRVSAMDMSRMRVIVDRLEAAGLNWGKIEDSLYEADLDHIDLATMANQLKRSTFASHFLEQVANDPGGCNAGNEPHDHVVVLVSQHLQYPAHTPIDPIQPEACPHCRFVYFRLTPFNFEPIDPYRDILRPIHPRSFNFSSPEGFRKALSELTVELSGLPED